MSFTTVPGVAGDLQALAQFPYVQMLGLHREQWWPLHDLSINVGQLGSNARCTVDAGILNGRRASESLQVENKGTVNTRLRPVNGLNDYRLVLCSFVAWFSAQ